MPTTADELKYSNITRIAGQGEDFSADVAQRSDGKNALCVDSRIDLATTLSNNTKLDFAQTTVALTTTYAAIYSYTGPGKLVGFVLDMDANTQIQYRLVIDGKVVFTDLPHELLTSLWGSPGNGQRFLTVGTTVLNNFDFQPPQPIAFSTSISIEVRRTTATARNLLRHLVVLVKGV
jgi:hypothetical protein